MSRTLKKWDLACVCVRLPQIQFPNGTVGMYFDTFSYINTTTSCPNVIYTAKEQGPAPRLHLTSSTYTRPVVHASSIFSHTCIILCSLPSPPAGPYTAERTVCIYWWWREQSHKRIKKTYGWPPPQSGVSEETEACTHKSAWWILQTFVDFCTTTRLLVSTVWEIEAVLVE